MDYHFDKDDAVNYGLDEAIVLYNLKFWILKNKLNNKNFFDGHYWTYNSMSAFQELFPFWSEKQIRRIIASLLEKEVIIDGNYNDNKYDHTKWYALKDESILPFEKIDLTKQENRFDQTGKSIYTYNKPNSKQDKKTISSEMVKKANHSEEKVATEQPNCEQVAIPQKNSFDRLTEWYCRHFVAGSEERKKQFLKDFGFFFYDLLDRCNDSVRLAGCVIKICKERYKCDLEGILSNFDNVLADAMTQAFGANPVIDTKKLEKDINKPRRKKTTLQIFSNFVLSKYEANGNNFTENQKSVWFKRNCKSMSDILKFCENDIELALECVKVCAERLEKAGFEGGLDAVARNINTYYLEAKKRLKRS